jgi:hypothetical protein
MPDPVAWNAVEKGWPVYDAGGAEIGSVNETAGDRMADIFDGFGVKVGEQVKYVPAESVASMVEGEVHLGISGADVAALEPMQEQVEIRVLPEGLHLHWYQRLYNWATRKNT